MAALEMLIGGTCIDISFSACQHNVCIKASGQQKLHKYDQYIYILITAS